MKAEYTEVLKRVRIQSKNLKIRRVQESHQKMSEAIKTHGQSGKTNKSRKVLSDYRSVREGWVLLTQ